MPGNSEAIKLPYPRGCKHDEAAIKRFIREAVAMDCAREAMSRINLNLATEPPSEIPEYTAYEGLAFGVSARHSHIIDPLEAYSLTHEIDHSDFSSTTSRQRQ